VIYSQLSHALKKEQDPFPDIDPKRYLAQSLNRLSREHPRKFGPVIESSVSAEMKPWLMQYFKTYQIPEPYIP